ncbi:hypothetical protein [Paracoccus onubensis]|uniref:Uncharacterized protein n=1 Tax=Paracoccus onubensis TaxID=1675788 RepID=A0A418T7W1_9RHOB|nr:hypothetical protein [Paracoccus onubensis]RJE89277.1 hypothetical protein D3P04_01130 [Paracoccus onubensis]
MSETPFLTVRLPDSPDPIRVAVRRMRWFRASFAAVVDRIGHEIGATIEIDDAALARCFVSWLRKVEQINPRSEKIRRGFFDHAAGLMLRELINAQPCRIVSPPTEPDPANPAHFWPEGYCYTIYCMNVRAAAIQQEYGEIASAGEELHDLRTWWSFRENTSKSGATAVAFFKLFAGGTPNWQMPDSFNPNDPTLLSPKPSAPRLG